MKGVAQVQDKILRSSSKFGEWLSIEVKLK